MKPVLIAKLALAGAGLLVWGLGARLDNAMLRWTGIGLLAMAVLLRFVKDKQDN
jgi:hypothetical protein